MRPRLAASCALLAVAGLITAGCSSTEPTAKPHPTSRVGAGAGPTVNRHGPFALGTRVETFVDTSRKTPPNGSVPEQRSRTLETLITYPAKGTPDPDHPIEGAAPADGRFPVALFVHGFSASRRAIPTCSTGRPPGSSPSRSSSRSRTRTPPVVRRSATRSTSLPTYDSCSRSSRTFPPEMPDLQPVIDGSRVGIIGQSRQGATVAFDLGYNSRFQDPPDQGRRCGLGGVWSGVLRASRISTGRSSPDHPVPVMFIHGTARPVRTDRAQTAQEYAKAPAPKFLAQPGRGQARPVRAAMECGRGTSNDRFLRPLPRGRGRRPGPAAKGRERPQP